MQLALDQHLVVPEEASFFMNMGQYKNLINYSHAARRPSLLADVLWGSFVTHSNEPQRTSAGRLPAAPE